MPTGMSELSINKLDGNIVQPQLSLDGISGFIFYHDELTDAEYTFFELKDAEDVGFEYFDGTGGILSIVHYHIKEYFKFTDFKLYVKCKSASDTYGSIDSEQVRANGEIKLFGIYDNISNYSSTNSDTISSKIADLATDRKRPAVCAAYTAPLGTTVESLTTLDGAAGQNTGSLIAQDLTTDSMAKALWDTEGGTSGSLIGAMGTIVGLTSSIGVADNAAHVALGNLSKEGEWLNIGFLDGSEYISKSQAFLDQLDNYRYQFARKIPTLSGSYLNYDWTSVDEASDYDQVALNRVYNKAFNSIYNALIFDLNGKLNLVSGGDLAPIQKSIFENKVSKQLDFMIIADEISDYSVTLPAQDVLTSREVKITVKVLPKGYAKYITVDFSYSKTV